MFAGRFLVRKETFRGPFAIQSKLMLVVEFACYFDNNKPSRKGRNYDNCCLISNPDNCLRKRRILLGMNAVILVLSVLFLGSDAFAQERFCRPRFKSFQTNQKLSYGCYNYIKYI